MSGHDKEQSMRTVADKAGAPVGTFALMRVDPQLPAVVSSP